MHIGMVGMGSIAQKAYLPILGTLEDVQLSIASRNQEAVKKIGRQYGVKNLFTSVEDLIGASVDAVFVHTATEAHVPIVKELIHAGIPVFVDKPIAASLKETEEIINLAESKQVPVWVGFNRRFAPFYREIKQQINILDTVTMQKNRVNSASPVRQVIFDDFIHVVDTLLFLQGDPGQVTVNGRFINDNLKYVTLQLNNGVTSGYGVMNRQAGAIDERLEITGDEKQIVIDKVIHKISFQNNEEQHFYFNDWHTTLYRRGFVDMIDHVLECIHNGGDSEIAARNVLKTHEICETIVQTLLK